VSAHADTTRGDGDTMARTAKKTTSRRSSTTSTRRSSTPAATRSQETPTVSETPSAAGIHDLAGGLQSFLTAIETEVRAVTGLSERIDALVTELNTVREEQSQRLLALDALRGSASDGGLTSFLDRRIRPRRPRVPEVVPDRLNQE
jgi:hypothetical protein